MRYEFSKEDEDFRQELRSWIRDEIPGEFKDWQGVDEADERAFDMARGGCVYIGFGAESASPHTLKHMKKGGFILKNGLTPTKVDGKIYEFSGL